MDRTEVIYKNISISINNAPIKGGRAKHCAVMNFGNEGLLGGALGNTFNEALKNAKARIDVLILDPRNAKLAKKFAHMLIEE